MARETQRTMRFPPVQHDKRGKLVAWTQEEVDQWRDQNGVQEDPRKASGPGAMIGSLVKDYYIKAPLGAVGMRLAQESGPLAKRFGSRLERLAERGVVLKPVGELGKRLQQIEGMPSTQDEAVGRMSDKSLAWQDWVDDGINRIIKRANTKSREALGAGITHSERRSVDRALLPAREMAGQQPKVEVSSEERMLADEYNSKPGSKREGYLSAELKKRHEEILRRMGDRYLRYLDVREIEQIMGGIPIDTTAKQETPAAKEQIMAAIKGKSQRQGVPVLRLSREEAVWAALFTGRWDKQIAFGRYGAEVEIENGRLILRMGQEESDIGPVDSVQVDIESPDGLEAAKALQQDLVSFPTSKIIGGLVKRIMGPENEVVVPGTLFLGRVGADEEFPLAVLDGQAGRAVLKAAIETFSELRKRRKAIIGPDVSQLEQMPEKEFVQGLKREYRQTVHQLPRASAVRRLAAENRGEKIPARKDVQTNSGQSRGSSARSRNFDEAARFLCLSDEQRAVYLKSHGVKLSVTQAIKGAKTVFWGDDDSRNRLKVQMVRAGQAKSYREITRRAQKELI